MSLDGTDIFILFLVAFGLAFLFLGFYFISKNVKQKKEDKFKFKRPNSAIKQCPVCDSNLVDKERIISRVYGKTDRPDQLCSIMGCPHCFPYPERGVVRKCPVCHKKISSDSYLIARLFNRQNEKNHIHIIGCTECHKKQ